MSLKERLAHLSPEQREEATTLLGELKKRRSQRKFFTMYPDEGKYRRELYPKHMEFIEASAEYKETCFMGANRCVTPWTYVETPNSSLPAHEAFFGRGAYVQSWDGERECTGRTQNGHLKGIEPAFRFVMDNGQFFDCSRTHQVLTPSGWTSADQLVSHVSGRRSTGRLSDYQASCVEGGYLRDRRPLSESGSAAAILQQLADARRYDLCYSRKDAKARVDKHIHACLEYGHPPSHDDQHLLSDLFERFSGPAMRSDLLPCAERCQGGRLSVDVLGLGQVAPATLGSLLDLMTYESAGLDDAGKPIVLMDGYQGTERYPNNAPLGGELGERRSGRDSGSISIFYPLKPLKLVGGSSVVAVVPLGYQPIIDVQVPNSNNYKAGGAYHHNCGKTVVGSYSKVCHLTGRYPDWWEGKVFDEPVMAWAAGDTAKNVRDIIQKELLGLPNAHGTGMIPGEDIIRCTPKAGTPDAVDTIYVKHYDADGEQDGVSTCQLKSYDQGRVAFQGTEQHAIWLDEECPLDVYMESLIRTMTTNGIVYLTFTPLKGITDVVQLFQNYDGD